MAVRNLLVTGASGKLGRLVLEHLIPLVGADRIVATTRNPDQLAAFAERGVEVRAADFDDETSLLEAFQGIDRLLIISTSTFDRPGHRVEQQRRAIEVAERSGVRHVLYTSVVRAGENTPLILGLDHVATEAALQASKLGYTFLRNNWYAENLEGDARYALQAGTVALASGEGKVGWVLRDDCALAAAHALADGFEGRRALDITGPEALSQSDLARILGEVSGKQVVSSPVPPDVRQQILVGAGVPAPFAPVLVDAEERIAEGWLAMVSGDVPALTGKAPRPVADYFRTLI